jgi:polysaccharide deacetylase family protein (PEP-CTERM system associated)
MTVKNILTVDVEDWFHICGVKDRIPRETWPGLESRVTQNTLKILAVLGLHGVKATFFVLGYVAERYPELIKKIQAAGHEIATHGYGHTRVYSMSPQSFRQDLRQAIQILKSITNRPVKGYRAPEWSIREDSLWALEILKHEGIEYDSSMAPLPIIGNRHYPKRPYRRNLGNGSLWEFPPLVIPFPFIPLPIAGGWGLRVFPYGLIRSEIMRCNNRGNPALIYIHPREFDLDCPRIALPWTKHFVLHARIERTNKRLNRLLKDFLFTSIEEYMAIQRQAEPRG